VEAAGGRVTVAGGSPLAYNAKADILNPYFLVTGIKTLLFLRVMGFQNGGPFLFPDSEKLLQS